MDLAIYIKHVFDHRFIVINIQIKTTCNITDVLMLIPREYTFTAKLGNWPCNLHLKTYNTEIHRYMNYTWGVS